MSHVSRRRKQGRGSRLKRSPLHSLTPKQERESSHWVDKVQGILAAYGACPNQQPKIPPYDRRDAILKRGIYQVVRQLRERANGYNIIESGALAACPSQARWPLIKENPFFWALKSVSARLDLRNDEVSRFAKELAYADRHQVDPHLLIGFLYQTGVTRIHAAPDGWEQWYVAHSMAAVGDGGAQPPPTRAGVREKPI